MATIRRLDASAETRTPVRIGRVSSREAERETRAIVSVNAAAGTTTVVSPPGSGSIGKSSPRSVRRWNVALPATSSTSCCSGRSSMLTVGPGSRRTTSSSSRAGRTTSPGRWTSAGSGARSAISMSVARSSTALSVAAIWTPESAWIADRVDAMRATTPRCVTNTS